MDTSFMLRVAMRQFSPDGFSWWDGATWMRSSEIELTPVTEFERSGRLAPMRDRLKGRVAVINRVLDAESSVGIDFVGSPFIAFSLFTQWSAYKAYHEWTIEQVEVATDQLLGPDEPLLAREASIWPEGGVVLRIRRDLGIAVTRSHVVLYSFADAESPTLRVVFAAEPTQVRFIPKSGIFMSGLGVVSAGRSWDLRGVARIFKPYPLMTAWRWANAAAATARA